MRRQMLLNKDILQTPADVWLVGRFDTPTLAQLRHMAKRCPLPGKLKLSTIRADVTDLHRDPDNDRSTFQVASQFNCLEMMGPNVSPAAGVGIYERDDTQGPACAIACGAATIARNYFYQTPEDQIDNLSLLQQALAAGTDLAPYELWSMQNGYPLVHASALKALQPLMDICHHSERTRHMLSGLLKVGNLVGAEVSLSPPEKGNVVNQVFVSALPISYMYEIRTQIDRLAGFARLILDASYEATVLAAQINAYKGYSKRLFLTRVGGGVFGNRDQWIDDAIGRAVARSQGLDLEIIMVER